MKKIKLLLFSAAIVAAGSAFTNGRMDGPDYVNVDGAWILKSTAEQSIGRCQSAAAVCTYTLLDGHQPNSASDFTTNPNEHAQFVKNNP